MTYLDKIRKLCKEQKKTIRNLEDFCGVSKGTAYKWNVSIPGVETVAKIAEFFDVPISYFTDEEVREEINNEPKIFDIDKELNEIIRKASMHDQFASSQKVISDALTPVSKNQLLTSLKALLEQQQHLAEHDE
jgi:transcriptional regulator with XRE-family HTH domain